jgi:acetyl-CoA carboxylase carboxyltransferase component
MTDAQDWEGTLDDLARRRRHALAMGGAERVARHRDTGKLDARARIDRLLDEGSFHEIGTLVGGEVAADKAAHFIMVADSFHLPIVFLADNPGMLPGSRSERSGVLRAGARMFAAQTAATTLKLHLTLRKAYGFGSMVMSMLGFDDQVATFAYPGATMGAMSAAALSRASNAVEDLSANLRDAELEASYRSAERFGFDELIDPRETRDALLAALQRGLFGRQVAAEPVSRTVIMP